MNKLLLLALLGGGYYFYTRKPKTEAPAATKSDIKAATVATAQNIPATDDEPEQTEENGESETSATLSSSSAAAPSSSPAPIQKNGKAPFGIKIPKPAATTTPQKNTKAAKGKKIRTKLVMSGMV